MSNQSERNKKIALLQQNLSSIRKIAGWTTEQLGEKIGVSKQTISNLENNKSPMNFTQYIAIRSILDCEIEDNKENEVLASVVEILLDKGDELEDKDYQNVKKSIDTVAAAAAGGVAGAALAGTYAGLTAPILVGLGIFGPVGAIVGGLASAIGATGTVKGSKWLKKILKNKNN